MEQGHYGKQYLEVPPSFLHLHPSLEFKELKFYAIIILH